jgi:hypothetical protein
MASPIPEFFSAPVDPALLDSAARQLGHQLPDDLAEMYAIADGVALDRWFAAFGGVPAYVLPGWELPPLAIALARSAELKRMAARLGSGSDDDEKLWRDDWLLVFSKLTTGDEHIVMATGQDRGSLWKVQWEFDLPLRLDRDLAGLLDAAVQRFLSLDAGWDPNIRQLVWDYGVGDKLGPFP